MASFDTSQVHPGTPHFRVHCNSRHVRVLGEEFHYSDFEYSGTDIEVLKAAGSPLQTGRSACRMRSLVLAIMSHGMEDTRSQVLQYHYMHPT